MKPEPYWTSRDGRHCLYLGDCLEVLPGMEPGSVDAIVTDPPYHRVKTDAWDRQWKTDADYLAWLGRVADEWRRVLKPNGSLYCFASPRMAARVEVMLGERFKVLNSIAWHKDEPTHALKYGDDRFRQYVQKSERIVFAEHYGADNMAKGEAGYAAKCDELRGFVFEPLRAYLAGERDRAGWTTRRVAEAFQARTGSRTVTGMAGHWFERVQWALPTEANYLWLREVFAGDYLRREYDYLRREYEDLRREYEDLRREYEDLRRPFSVSADVPYTDVWTFPTVPHRRGKHSCEKPLAMMEHIITASTRPGAVVLDSFCGSGSTGEAALRHGRRFFGIEADAAWVAKAGERLSRGRYADIAVRRMERELSQPHLPGLAPHEAGDVQRGLFGE